MSKTAIKPTRSENFAEWYQQIVQQADLAENSSVRGCMVIKPYGYAIWENIQKIFDAKLKKLNVQNAYFPLLIPIEFLTKEAEHIDGFAKECAVVTHHRLKKNDAGQLVPDGELTSPYIIRPTSEAIIGHTVSNWIQTYRDLPMKLNQWCNVMRWEMRPRVFLRTSEFLWQEGHTIFETEQEAHDDARNMLDVYYNFVTKELALPAIKGEKTNEERFPGAKNTYTIEMMMQDGKALQAGTSHYLGQVFSKAFDIKFSGRDNAEHHAYTSSWGITTRLIGAIIMAHSDDDGLVLPPAIAPYHVVIIPVIHDAAKFDEVMNYCTNISNQLDDLDIRVHIDMSENSTPNKIWKWVKKGVPIRFEIGAREVAENKITLVRRDIGKEGKLSIDSSTISQTLDILSDINNNIRTKAESYKSSKIKDVGSLEELDKLFSTDFTGFANIPKTETDKAGFEEFAKKHALTRRCIPLDDNDQNNVIVAKSY